MEFTLLEMTEVLKIAFRADTVSLLFAALTTVMWILAGIYSFGYMKHDARKKNYAFFYVFVYFVLLGLDFSANLVTLYLFYELMTLSSMPLILHERAEESISAAMKYLYYSIAGAFLALFGIFVLANHATTLDFVAGGSLALDGLTGGTPANTGLILAGVFLMILGFGAKAGMFPLHAWLPIAHPVAPAPASAVLSGVITKAGVLAILRIVFYVAGADIIRGSWVQIAWMSLALLTIVMGSTRAFEEKVLKKRLAYSTVSQVSYVLFGLSTLHPVGVTGALLHVIFHSTSKDLLFLGAGSIIHQTGKTQVDALRGVGRKMPVTLGCFAFASLSLVGIPPFAGFFSKWYLANGSLAADISGFSWIGPVVLLLSALLTAGYLFPIVVQGFLPGKEQDGQFAEKCEAGLAMTVPMCILAALTVLLGVFSGPVISCLARLAESLM